MREPEPTKQITFEDFPFEDLTGECIEEPAPDTLRSEDITEFNATSGIVL